MKAEIRADGVHITGYVNVPGRQSKPVITPRGKVIEVIEQRAFQKAIDAAEKIELLLDHEKSIASTETRTLKVKEDAVGLYADAIVTDKETVQAAKDGKLKGWSFNMRKVVDSIEERADQLPIRHVKSFEMDEITLVLHKNPCYSSTSIELRADEEEETETRAEDLEVELIQSNKTNYEEYEKRLKKIKAAE